MSRPDAYRSLLKPEVVDTVKGLELLARIVVEELMSGANASRRVGVGQEFSQYRSYEPGDDLRLLDWKMYGRSERYYIKQSEIETHITIKFVLDASASMLHEDHGGLTKLQYARVLMASLAYLAERQGDTYGLFAINEAQHWQLFPRHDKQHFQRFLYQLVQIDGQGKFPQQERPETQFRRGEEKELVVFLSDLYGHQEELKGFVQRLKTVRNEVLLFHIQAGNEAQLDYSGVVTFEDHETGQRVQVNAAQVRAEYRRHWEEFTEGWKQEALQRAIDYQAFRMDGPLEEALRDYLRRRKFLQ